MFVYSDKLLFKKTFKSLCIVFLKHFFNIDIYFDPYNCFLNILSYTIFLQQKVTNGLLF